MGRALKKTARRQTPNGPRRVGLEIAKADYTESEREWATS
jgi:hypothetical protein